MRPFLTITRLSLPVALASLLIIITPIQAQEKPEVQPSAKPSSFEAKTTEAQEVHFPSDYKGKVVLLDFWATWCGPCRAELPNVRKAYENLHAKGFEILGVSLDRQESLQKLAAFVKENHMPWPQICDGKGWEAELAKKYAVRAIPAAFLVDGSTGKILAEGKDLRGVGLEPAVEAALGVKSTGNPSPVVATEPKSVPAIKSAPVPAKAGTPSPPDNDPLVAKAEAALKQGKLLGNVAFLEQRNSPTPGTIDLPAASTTELKGRDIAKMAKEGYLRVGWFYHCTKCGNWHIKTAGGYAIAHDAIATAWHVMTPPDTLKEGFAIAVDVDENIVPITGVIASDSKMDAMVMRVGAGHFRPLALSPLPEVGDSVYCFSDPLRQRNYFTAGMVNRVRMLNDNGGAPINLADPASLRINVSTDWAPGSSGAAVLDACGNVVGHVATMATLFERTPSVNASSDEGSHAPDRFHGASLITMHDAVPAWSVLSLLKRSVKGVAKE